MPAVITRLPTNELLLLGQTLWQRPRLFHTATLSSFMHLSTLVDAGTAHTCLPSNRELHNPTVVCSACTVTYDRYARSERWLSKPNWHPHWLFLSRAAFHTSWHPLKTQHVWFNQNDTQFDYQDLHHRLHLCTASHGLWTWTACTWT